MHDLIHKLQIISNLLNVEIIFLILLFLFVVNPWHFHKIFYQIINLKLETQKTDLYSPRRPSSRVILVKAERTLL